MRDAQLESDLSKAEKRVSPFSHSATRATDTHPIDFPPWGERVPPAMTNDDENPTGNGHEAGEIDEIYANPPGDPTPYSSKNSDIDPLAGGHRPPGDGSDHDVVPQDRPAGVYLDYPDIAQGNNRGDPRPCAPTNIRVLLG